jgi:hypothetical protein
MLWLSTAVGGGNMRKGLRALFIGGALVVAAATQAAAECCVRCCIGFVETCACGPAVLEPPLPGEMYVVNQGPVLSGPGPVLRQPRDYAPPYYPYVGRVYSGYPFGADGGGYPRGSYNPFVGYPFAEAPSPYFRYHYYG